MAPLEFPNTDFFNLQSSLIQLLRALDDASTQRTVRKGARQSAQAPTQEFNTNVQGDLRSVLQSPLYKREPRGYSALQLDAVHSIRPLHESIVRLLTRGTVNATDTVDNEDTDTDLRGRLHDFVESVDPAHPFLQIALETKDTSGGDVDDDDDDDGEGAGAEQQKKKKKKKQALSKKAKGKQRADRDASHGKIQAA
ncbi:MAG: hypothetical protein LQ337_007106 [Flavoplaca oasis]|nr:MAG: hypothetical protein LQ337_007106 [Flavoplaca oasis]